MPETSVPVATTQFDTENAIRHAELKKLLAMGGMATLAGAGIAGTQGLIDLYRRTTTPPRQDAGRPRLVRIPYKTAEEIAAPVAPAPVPTLPSATLGDRITSTVQRAMGGVNTGNWGDVKGTLMGAGAASGAEMPWRWPAAAALIGGGMAGGYAGMSSLVHGSKEREHKHELERARADYESALNTSAPTIKTAAENDDDADLGMLLDKLYDTAIEKQAINSALAAMLGLALTTTGATALLTGAATHGYLKQRDGGDPVRKAIEERQARSVSANPPPIYLVPVPAKSDDDKKNEAPSHMPQLPRPKFAATVPLGTAIGAAMSRDAARRSAAAEQTRLMMGGKPPAPPKPTPPPAAPAPPTIAGINSLKR